MINVKKTLQILIALSIIWAIISIYWYSCQIKNKCSIEANTPIAKVELTVPPSVEPKTEVTPPIITPIITQSATEVVTSPAVVVKPEPAVDIAIISPLMFYFENGGNQPIITPALQNDLRNLKEYVISNKKTLIITGHTDNVGDDFSNIKLGLKRAQSLAKKLQELGITPENILSQSVGEDSPIADNTSAQGRAQNRRAEVTIKE